MTSSITTYREEPSHHAIMLVLHNIFREACERAEKFVTPAGFSCLSTQFNFTQTM